MFAFDTSMNYFNTCQAHHSVNMTLCEAGRLS